MNRRRVEILLNWVGVPLVMLYAWCMLLHPWLKSDWDWIHVHAVWYDWQTLNAALLAFVASLIALNISRIKEEKQREREFLSSRAFLPSAFSELSNYFQASADYLSAVWSPGSTGQSAPAPAESYRSVFLDCIRHATPEVGEYLAEILAQLQVHESRLEELSRRPTPASDPFTLISYMFALGKMKVFVDKQYDFARGRTSFIALPATLEEFRNAYNLLRLHPDVYKASETFTLQSLTERYVSRTGGGTTIALSPIRAWLSRLQGKTK